MYFRRYDLPSESTANEPVPDYRVKKPMTNYDLLISKTPEELAEYIRVFFPEVCPPGNCPGEDSCYKCWLDWLKSPVEVDK